MVEAATLEGGVGAAANGATEGTGGYVVAGVPLLGRPSGVCVESGAVDDDGRDGGGRAIAATTVVDGRARGAAPRPWSREGGGWGDVAPVVT